MKWEARHIVSAAAIVAALVAWSGCANEVGAGVVDSDPGQIILVDGGSHGASGFHRPDPPTRFRGCHGEGHGGVSYREDALE